MQVCDEDVGRYLLSVLGDNIKKLRDDSRGKHVKNALWQLYERLPRWEEAAGVNGAAAVGAPKAEAHM